MTQPVFAHVALCSVDPVAVERFYTRHFGFTRARVYQPGPGQVVMLRSGAVCLELFRATEEAPHPAAGGAGPEYPSWRHIAFAVDDLDAKLAEMGADAVVTLGPLDMSRFVPGMRACWLRDPGGNTVELSQGYVDEIDPPPAEAGRRPARPHRRPAAEVALRPSRSWSTAGPAGAGVRPRLPASKEHRP